VLALRIQLLKLLKFLLVANAALACFAFCLCAPRLLAAHENSLRQLSFEEKVDLEDFFYFLFAREGFGYSLFGDKPLSFCFVPSASIHIATKDHFFKICIQGDHSYTRGVEAWKKIPQKDREPQHLLIVHEKNRVPFLAVIINVHQLTGVFNNNRELFKQHWDQGITATAVIRQLMEDPNCLPKLFKNHLLLGVLLGYGKHNAEMFQRRADLCSPFFKTPLTGKRHPSAPFQSLDKELYYLQKKLTATNRKDPYLYPVSPVMFAMDLSHAETQTLRKKYDLLHKDLSRLMKQNNWLEIILEKLS